MFGKFIGAAGSFAVPFAVIFVLLILVFIVFIIIGGAKLKKIMRANHLKIVFNDYWTTSDNNGTLLKSSTGEAINIFPITKVPIDFNKEKKNKVTLLGNSKIEVISFKHLKKNINGFSWDILLYKTAPLAVLLAGYLSLETNGIRTETEIKLKNESDFETENIDFNIIFSFLQKAS
ncbi:MAG: hypothetical protein LBM00_05105 [Deltaproteobacteria bacterium]|jgi:hypothetical protein|nr:hypothetical protein [Deltaproteobacteria bacterium]